MKKLAITSALLASAMAIAPAAQATDFSFVGNFNNANDVQLFTFSVGAPSTVTLRTWSYAGGTNAAGAVIARGGFDPILALFDSSGLRINQNDDGGALVAADSVTGAHFDTFLSSVLNPGTYTVSVMAFSNFSLGPNLSDGFSNTGSFTDVTGNQRDTHWAFDVLNVNAATTTPGVPEPATWAMMLVGFGLMGGAIRSSRRKQAKVNFAF